MSRLKVAVVGVGHLGKHHARILAGLSGVELVAVVDQRIEQAQAVAAMHGAVAFPDHRDLIGMVDAVSIAVPTRFHREVAGYFLNRGVPCMVEKPLATTLSEAEQLVELSEARESLLQVGHVERFNPAMTALEGMALRPKYISAERLGTYTFRSTDIGVVLDLMIHDIDLLLSLTNAPVRTVSAVGVSIFGGHEDVANARIEFADGCVANLTASRASFQAVRKMRIWGPEGYAALDFAAKHGTLIRPSDDLRRGELDLDGLDFAKVNDVRDRIFGKILRVDQVQAENRDALTAELEDFVTAVKTGSRPKVTGVDALRAMRLADQILRSLNTHRWEGLEEGPTGPFELPEPIVEPIVGLSGPKTWKYHGVRDASRKSETTS